jgi:hypothetical protein
MEKRIHRALLIVVVTRVVMLFLVVVLTASVMMHCAMLPDTHVPQSHGDCPPFAVVITCAA